MLRFAFNFILFFFVLGLIFFAGLSWYLLPQLPDIGKLRDIKLQVPLRIYSQDDSLIAEFGEKRRRPISIEEVPTPIIQAFLAAEDDRFYQHPGVDWQGIMRAVVHLIKTGDKSQGGSTITMQVARNFFLSREKTYLRKLNEIFLALKIERELSKDQILELYLNKIYLGHRSYGIAAASQTYYGVEINELTLAQVAMLASLPKAPSTTNPVTNPTRAKTRRNYVLQRMLEENFLSEEDYQTAYTSPITASLHNPFIEVEAPYVAEMIRKQLIEQYGNSAYINGLNVTTTIRDKNQIAANHALRKALLEYDERHGYRGPEHHYDLKTGDDEVEWQRLLESFPSIGSLYPALVVQVNERSITSYLSGIGLIDVEWSGLAWARAYLSENRRSAKPKTASEFLKTGDVIRLSEDSQGEWKLSQIPEVEGGFVSMDPNDGATLALVGGFDYQRSKFNRVMQAFRQPGSGFKPFIYSAGLAAGNTAATLINDAPVIFEDPGVEEIWRPENYSRKSYGPTRLREGLIHSRNLVSIRLLHAIGVPFALQHIKKFGFNIDGLPKNLSLSLGSATLTPWQMASAYCVFANGGYGVEPYLIETIATNEGEILYQADPVSVCRVCVQQEDVLAEGTQYLAEHDSEQLVNQSKIAKRVVDERNIWIINSITRDVIKHGTGRRALVLKRQDLSGKTGTTNDQRDAWFFGFNPDIVAVAWVGFDKFQPLGSRETGARAALPIWLEYMKTVLEDIPEHILPEPPGLVYSRINKTTGKLAQANDPDAMFEVFRTEYAPTSLSDETRPPSLDSNAKDSEMIDLF
ncbi:MAG: penicillin-binding protein 1A [Proteobacteria bacterium]|nr:penicillin-binding protein 1A [Pseudomonadota bacterium]